MTAEFFCKESHSAMKSHTVQIHSRRSKVSARQRVSPDHSSDSDMADIPISQHRAASPAQLSLGGPSREGSRDALPDPLHDISSGPGEDDTFEASAGAAGPWSSQQSNHIFEPLIESLGAARLLGNLHVKTLQRYARLGRVPGYQIGGHWYFRASELDAWLRLQINSKCQSVR
jgi:excisionase family DNA binding protein